MFVKFNLGDGKRCNHCAYIIHEIKNENESAKEREKTSSRYFTSMTNGCHFFLLVDGCLMEVFICL